LSEFPDAGAGGQARSAATPKKNPLHILDGATDSAKLRQYSINYLVIPLLPYVYGLTILVRQPIDLSRCRSTGNVMCVESHGNTSHSRHEQAETHEIEE
jgi:hypothetical protein